MRFATDAETNRYAAALIDEGLGLRRGDALWIRAEPLHRAFVNALAGRCLCGGIDVDADYADPVITHQRLREAPESLLGRVSAAERARIHAFARGDTALLALIGDERPGLLRHVSPQRLALHAQGRGRVTRPALRAETDATTPWSVANWPTPAWAALVYRDLAPAAARRRLFEDILNFCRVGPDDPDDALRRHHQLLSDRAGQLTARRLRRLELRGPGTHLDVELAASVAFAGGGAVTPDGRRFVPNIPTEEVFTVPVATATNGTFRCTRPVCWNGLVVHGLRGEFRGGRLRRLEADHEQGRASLAALLATDAGGSRLGEVALVDDTSRIGRAQRVYHNTGLDENAASHMAFGQAITSCLRDADPDVRTTANRSHIHIDVMIGGDDVDVTGVERHAQRVPVLRSGRFVI